MRKLNNMGYYTCILFALSLFLSEKFENNVLVYLLTLLFTISLFFKNNREKLKEIADRKISFGLLLFVFIPYTIVLIDGGLKTRLEINEHLKFLMFFPLTIFIDEEKKFWNFTKALMIGAIISLSISLGIFIRDYEKWSNPSGFNYPRIYFELSTQDFANIMCIVLIFLLSFLLFYNKKSKKENLKMKLFLGGVIALNIFILIVNRSKMVYVCLPLVIIYILYKKNRKYILLFLLICLGGYFMLPDSVSERIQYIVKYKKDPSSNLRIIFWKTAVAAIKEKPLFGWKAEERLDFNNSYYQKTGTAEYVKINYTFTQLGDFLNTHNMYLQYLVYFGLIGGIFLIILFFIIIPSRLIRLDFYKQQKCGALKFSSYPAFEIALKASYMCFLIQGLTDKNINNAAMIITFSILLFMINFIYMKTRRNNK